MMQDFSRLFRQSPETVGAGRLAPRAVFFPHSTEAEALEGGHGKWYCSLNGNWRFKWFENPDRMTSEYRPETPDADWAEIAVPGCWDMQGYGYPHYTNVNMPFPEFPPEVPKQWNPSGVYRRTFTLPDAWRGRRTILHFDGVENLFYVFLNGELAGFSKDSRGASEFDITDKLREGENQIAVFVIQFSDAAYTEDQDQWWHAGIVRGVYLLSRPQSRIEDVFAAATLDPSLKNGLLKLELTAGFRCPEGSFRRKEDGTVEFNRKRPNEGWFFDLRLLSAEGVEVWKETTEVARKVGAAYYDVRDPARMYGFLDAEIPDVHPWSAEDPYRYTLTVTLRHESSGVVESTALKIGFRRVEIRRRELLINGKPVLIQGVNRHEHDPKTGRTVSAEAMRRDLILMKQFNFNAIRTCHYPDAPEFYDLCDELGMYVFDEANIECHAFFYDLCANPSWGQAYLDRAIHLVTRDKNHPSVIVWSLGNESGVGVNHASAAAWIRYYDPSRPLLCERASYSRRQGGWAPNVNRTLTDIIAPMYPEVQWIVNWAETQTEDDRPLICCEYSHAMGNSNGALREYFEAFRTHHGLQGGFIWEWCDHGILRKDAEGRDFFAYGGDFGDQPNDFNFVCDGMVSPDRVPHAGMYEFKKLAAPVEFSAVDLNCGRIRIRNRRYFTSLDDCEILWRLTVNGREHSSGRCAVPHLGCEFAIQDLDNKLQRNLFITPPDNTAVLTLPYAEPENLKIGDECRLLISLRLKQRCAWAEAGHELGWEEFVLPFRSLTPPAPEPIRKGAVEVTDNGVLHIADSSGVVVETAAKLNLWRATTDNDCRRHNFATLPVGDFAGNIWWSEGLFDQKRTGVLVRKEGADTVVVSTYGTLAEHTMTIRQEADGAFRFCNTIVYFPELRDLPRVGLELELPGTFSQVEYWGRGPWENYRDRNAGAPVGRYVTTVREMEEPYIVPQEYGNRTEVRELILSDGSRRLAIVPDLCMEFSVSRFDSHEMQRAHHWNDLKDSGRCFLHLDLLQRGLGTHSCGPDTLPEYRIPAGTYHFNFRLFWKA